MSLDRNWNKKRILHLSLFTRKNYMCIESLVMNTDYFNFRLIHDRQIRRSEAVRKEKLIIFMCTSCKWSFSTSMFLSYLNIAMRMISRVIIINHTELLRIFKHIRRQVPLDTNKYKRRCVCTLELCFYVLYITHVYTQTQSYL